MPHCPGVPYGVEQRFKIKRLQRFTPDLPPVIGLRSTFRPGAELRADRTGWQ